MFKIFLLLSWALSDSPRVVNENNKAAKLIESDRTLEAQQMLQNSVVNHSDRGEFHYNLGLTYERNEDYDSALKEYRAAIQSSDNEELKFKALFNSGSIFGVKKQVAEALRSYQAALDIKPDSVETKTNIELLLKQAGGGSGSGKDKKEQNQGQNENQDQQNQGQKEGQNEDQKQNQGQKEQQQGQKKTPKEFKSENLSKQDVKKIFEELERQEDKIRGKILEKKSKGATVEKDW